MKSKIMTVIDAKSYSLSHRLFSTHLQYANSILFFFLIVLPIPPAVVFLPSDRRQ